LTILGNTKQVIQDYNTVFDNSILFHKNDPLRILECSVLGQPGLPTIEVCVCFITAGPITKLFAWGGRRVEDMCYERRRAKACVDDAAHHALVNVGCREIV
jgi:hypothetical protein